MPFYYSLNRLATTNAAAATLSTHLRLLTIANQFACRIIGVHGAARFSTAGGAMLRLIRGGAAGTGGTAQIPAKKNPDMPVAATTAFNDATAITPGTTPVTKLTVGMAQTGGHGGYVALENDHAELMKANGGANGNMELGSFANAAAVPFEATLDIQEA